MNWLPIMSLNLVWMIRIVMIKFISKLGYLRKGRFIFSWNFNSFILFFSMDLVHSMSFALCYVSTDKYDFAWNWSMWAPSFSNSIKHKKCFRAITVLLQTWINMWLFFRKLNVCTYDYERKIYEYSNIHSSLHAFKIWWTWSRCLQPFPSVNCIYSFKCNHFHFWL